MGLLDGKRGIIFGIANDRSYAWFISKQLTESGAQCLFTHLPDDKGKMERRCRSAIKELGIEEPWLLPCDASKDADLDTVFNKVKADFGTIDFVVHSIAFADRQFLQIGNFHATTREAWTQALDISAYTLLAMGRRSMAVMPNGGSLVAMTYYGGEKAIPGYNLMGVAKAALEASVRYLAVDLGKQAIRVNAISAGPIKTLAASGIGDFRYILKWNEYNAPLKRSVTIDEVGQSALYLLSDMSRGVTGEVHHVDCGYHTVGMKAVDAPDISVVKDS